MQSEVEKLEHRLYGNGQPGDVGKIETRLDEHDDRLRQLDEKWWKAMAIGGVLAFASGGGDLSLTALRHWLLEQ